MDNTADRGVLLNLDLTVVNNTVNWQKQLGAPGSSGVVMNKAAAVLNKDKSKVYAAIPIGTSKSTTPLVFMTLNETTGELIGDLLVSSDPCTGVEEINYFFNKIYILGQFNEARILILDPEESSSTSIDNYQI